MAEIIALPGRCGACDGSEPASFVGWLRLRIGRLTSRRRRVGNADDMPEHMRRDMGLAPRPAEPGRHYFDYLSSRS